MWLKGDKQTWQIVTVKWVLKELEGWSITIIARFRPLEWVRPAFVLYNQNRECRLPFI